MSSRTKKFFAMLNSTETNDPYSCNDSFPVEQEDIAQLDINNIPIIMDDNYLIDTNVVVENRLLSDEYLNSNSKCDNLKDCTTISLSRYTSRTTSYNRST